jgi:hypothetical protein
MPTFIKYVFIILLSLLVITIAFFYVSYIDKTTTQGTAYHFEIGLAKDKAYNLIEKFYAENNMYLMFPLDDMEYGPLISVKDALPEYGKLKESNMWILYFGKNFRNVLKLKFENDKLVSIYRHRQYFEFP